MNKPLVSIIIPVYNVEKYLRECLNSVIKQTLTQIEIICINDGSTDSSADILKEYSSADHRITIITKENGGLSNARNAGLKIATGQYITFLDSDDYLTLNALESLYNKATNEELDILIFCAKSFSEKGFSSHKGKQYTICPLALTKVLSGPDFFVTSFKCNNHIGTSPIKIYRNDFLKDNNLKFIEGIYHEDEPFYYEAILAAKRVAKIPEQFYCRRYREGSITTISKNSKHIIGKLAAISRILELSKSKQLSANELQTTMEFVAIISNNIALDYYSLNKEELSKLSLLSYEQQHLLQLAINLTNGKRIAIIENSFSYKLGMALTKPIRWFYEAFHK